MKWARLVAAIAASALVVQLAMAQGEPPRIVQGSDGTLYLLKNGARSVIAVDSIGDDELSGFADAGTIDGADLVTALTSVQAAPTQVVIEAPAQPPTNAAQPPSNAAPTAPACRAQPVGAKSSASCAGSPTPQFLSVRGAGPGGTASVSVNATPGTVCSLKYQPPAGGAAVTPGDQTADANGIATWTFGVGSQAGQGTLVAACGQASVNSTIQVADPTFKR